MQLKDLSVVENKNGSESEKAAETSGTIEESKSSNELICLDTNAGESDGFITQDDLNDDYFNPRESDEDDSGEFNPRAAGTTVDSPATKAAPPATAPPVLSPPPALPPRDPAKVNNVVTQQSNNNDKFHADHFFTAPVNNANATNPFSSTPFAPSNPASDPFGMSSFNANSSAASFDPSPFSKITGQNASGFGDGWTKPPTLPAINAMSLDDLDPLKK